MATQKRKVLVVGLGQMGKSHALAHHKPSGFETMMSCFSRLSKRTACVAVWS